MRDQRKDLAIPTDKKSAEHALLKQGIIMLIGTVNRQMFEDLYEKIALLMAVGSPNITLRITSSGGSVNYGFDIYDLLRTYTGEITGIVVSEASSSASFILQGCTHRHMLDGATMLIHHSTINEISYLELRSKKKLAERLKTHTDNNNRIVDIYVKRTGVARRTILQQMNKNTTFRSKRALELGLIDKII